MTDAIQQFRSALAGRGIVPPADLLSDGKLHRCDIEGPGGKGDGAYLLHLNGVPAGGFENWRDGLGWQNWRADAGGNSNPADEATRRAQIEAMRRARESEVAQRCAQARERASIIWAEARACVNHPYLAAKGIGSHGARLHQDCLVLPICNANGELLSLQFIGPDGGKKFLTGGRIKGGYFVIGEPAGVLCIAEGFATGASIHEATGLAVAVAFDAGNLMAVAGALQQTFQTFQFVLCADDDFRTEGNPGKRKALEAAKAVGGAVAFPDFGADRPDGATDFNDLHQLHGLEAVRRCIDPVVNGQGAASSGPQMNEGDPTGEDSASCSYAGGRFEISSGGVLFIASDNDKNKSAPRWICSHLAVLAKTRDAKSGAWGRLLEWRDDDGVRHQWAMPLELLQGDGCDVRRELARLGLSIAPGKAARDLLASYLQVWPVETRARCVERLGWHGSVYVTPTESIGQASEIVAFQNAHAIEPAFSVTGTAEAWRDAVGVLASGNSRLVFALSVAFAGPLADIVGEDSGGFHFRGISSSGKSTALKVAASVWGDPNAYPRLWRATANGLEGLAALHNDGTLILDELSQIDPREAGEAAYLLANGQGKARASRSGTARQSARWRLLFLSAGEESLAALMARVGRRANAGQEIRLADIDADAGTGMGAFEDIHDYTSPAAFALAVKDAALRCHGAVGVAWLRAIVADRPNLAEFISDGIRQFVEESAPKEGTGQVQRVARRFALVAVAGELATHYGLTGWRDGEAIVSVRKCFEAWLESFGGAGNREERAILSQVRAFFEAHGASRFENAAATQEQRIPNRAGFYRESESGNREFMVLPESFKRDICQGFDAKTVTRVLIDAKWLQPGNDGKTAQKPRIPGIGPTRCYIFTQGMWEGD